MKKAPGAIVILSAVIFSAVIATPAFAHYDSKTGHHAAGHHRHHHRSANTMPSAPHSIPSALDRRDPSRPGGLDPSFNPRGR
jgi:hypothetical protein